MPDLRVVLAVAALGLVVSVASAVVRSEVVGEYFAALPAVAVPTAVGRVVRRLHQQARRLEELTLHLEYERERAERAERAAAGEERVRIARELHDVVAHGISVIAIQADAAEAALEHDPALARAPLATIRTSATAALTEMRQLLGVLREDGDGGELAPQPGLAQLDALIAQARRAGVDVALEVAGTPRTLAPASTSPPTASCRRR